MGQIRFTPLWALTLTIALVPTAAAAAVLPPGNSAANQYTEAYPTAGGSMPTGRPGHSTTARALGAKNAKRLDAQGPEGRAAAAVAAATAPVTDSPSGSNGGSSAATRAGDATVPGDGGSGSKGGADGSGGSSSAEPDRAVAASSGLEEVLGQATGSSSSGQLGLLLPLLVLGVVAWAVVYAIRSRRRTG